MEFRRIMGIKQDFLNAFDSMKTVFSDAVISVIYNGKECEGLKLGANIIGLPSSFVDDTSSNEFVYVKHDDIDKPVYGERISIDNDDRIIVSAPTDALEVLWKIDHVAYYDKIAAITFSTTVDIDIKCRVIDPELDQFTQFESDASEMYKYEVCIRQDDWPYETVPSKGSKVSIEGYNDIYVMTVNKIGGDYRLMCREAGNSGD